MLFFGVAVANATPVPAPCHDIEKQVALLDCLQDQQDLLEQILIYEQTRTQIERIRQEQAQMTAPQPIVPEPVVESAETESELAAAQIAWFDQQLEVYAVIGNDQSRTAYARLDGREYRLKEGDSLRLAKILRVHPRSVELSILNHSFEIGLSGRNLTTTQVQVKNDNAAN